MLPTIAPPFATRSTNMHLNPAQHSHTVVHFKPAGEVCCNCKLLHQLPLDTA